MSAPPIRALGKTFDVSACLAEIARQPDVWDRFTMRTAYAQGAHRSVSDIWVRYNAWANFHGDPHAFNAEHESTWYPVADQLPAVKQLTFDVMRYVEGTKLGGVLITRIPAGGGVQPHADIGWHAQHYEKFAVQLQGNAKQAFCFEGISLSPEPGELYTFDNSRLHWVTNDSDSDRMTLIVCIRR